MRNEMRGSRNRGNRRGGPPGRPMGRRPSVEVEGNSVDEAIVKALTELRVPKDKASIEVLDEGKADRKSVV